MHTGKIKKVIIDRGFGFISDTDGNEVFFHQSALVDLKITDVTEGQEVEFDIEKTPKGPRAINVHVLPKA